MALLIPQDKDLQHCCENLRTHVTEKNVCMWILKLFPLPITAYLYSLHYTSNAPKAFAAICKAILI